jgi:putative flippase GtrA
VLARFYSVGLACALLHNAIMIAGDWLGAHYAVSSAASYVIVVLFGYWLHTTWTWPGTPRARMSLARYALTMSANMPLFIAGMFVFVDLAQMPVAIASPVVTVILMAFNFVAARWALRA